MYCMACLQVATYVAKGKSTVILSKSSRLHDRREIHRRLLICMPSVSGSRVA